MKILNFKPTCGGYTYAGMIISDPASWAEAIWPDHDHAWDPQAATLLVPTVHPNIPIYAISPSSLSLYYSDRAAWAERYLSSRVGDPQTPAMAVGTWFDVLIKERIGADFNISLDRDRLYASVECQDARAKSLGADCYSHYISSGAYTSLSRYMRGDISVEGDILGRCFGVPMRGKPDLSFVDGSGRRVILDWKVNGVYGRPISPTAGYIDSFPQRVAHKNATCLMDDGIMIDATPGAKRPHMEQLLCYDILMGGSGVGIHVLDQLTTSPTKGLRTTRCCYKVSINDVIIYKDKLISMWENLSQGIVFSDDPEDQIKQAQIRGPTGTKLIH